jgi:hypothetical protein
MSEATEKVIELVFPRFNDLPKELRLFIVSQNNPFFPTYLSEDPRHVLAS